MNHSKISCVFFSNLNLVDKIDIQNNSMRLANTRSKPFRRGHSLKCHFHYTSLFVHFQNHCRKIKRYLNRNRNLTSLILFRSPKKEGKRDLIMVKKFLEKDL